MKREYNVDNKRKARTIFFDKMLKDEPHHF